MREVDPQSTPRALAFELWSKAPMPMVTLMKTLDVTPLVRLSRKRNYKFNMLLCWCIGVAAVQTEDFYLLLVGDKLMQYDKLAVNTVVATRDGGIATCDIPVSTDLEQFDRDYRSLTGQVYESGESYELGEDYMVIGTSALAGYEIDGAVNIYAGCYNNPFLIWGKYRKKWLRATLPVSFQFHHTQMDGIPAAAFLERLQGEIRQAGRKNG
ncbi:CatA-like O-acetyltransferase, family 2 [Flavonifractor sp. An306]|uniref:CatA-like O-acetyltransferase, family 2 n=1 Tax=Flavonifractor sp. An306 TaxID=1965629 RepID=UPI000B36A650|nr:CatA-like O-acetyltransferase, family 2 [Flavonifractor sp. An306]OUO35195.1 chloramphenicol acetyltransferase [Flavonifractor sp. An306]